MRALLFAGLFLISTLPAMAQNADDSKPGLPKDPRAVFAAAAPFYDFSDPALKPWHMKASYQLYDDKGKPAEQGTYEYWWASPKVYRSTWTRAGASRTDWHTADGKHSYTASGDDLSYFEYQLQELLLSPLPSANWLDPAIFSLLDKSLTVSGSAIPCYQIVPVGVKGNAAESLSGGQYLKYCFDPRMPIVVGVYSYKTLLSRLGDFVQMQGKVLPRRLVFKDGKRDVLTANVEVINLQSVSTDLFVPSATAVLVKAETLKDIRGVVFGKNIKRADFDPLDDLVSHSAQAKIIIGTDGHIREIRMITFTSPAYAKMVKKTVSQWTYVPSTLNGVPVQVEMDIEVGEHPN
jgi:hypothetical protein